MVIFQFYRDVNKKNLCDATENKRDQKFLFFKFFFFLNLLEVHKHQDIIKKKPLFLSIILNN